MRANQPTRGLLKDQVTVLDPGGLIDALSPMICIISEMGMHDRDACLLSLLLLCCFPP
jgi:hypothetical protein